MSTIEEHLARIDHWLDQGEAERPQRELEALIGQMNDAGRLRDAERLRNTVQRFRPKRRRDLSRLLESKVGSGGPQGAADRYAPAAPSTPTEPDPVRCRAPDSALDADFRQALDALRNKHIFQWSTFYRDCFGEYLGRFLDAMRRAPCDDDGRSLSAPLADHARDVFGKGYEFVRDRRNHDEAVRKSPNGLSRFLALPLDFYSVRSAASSDRAFVSALRLLLSAAVSGILEGYSSASFGPQTGSALLSRFQRSWMPYAAFLLPRHAESLAERLAAGRLVDGLKASVLPLLDAFQRFHERTDDDDDYRPLPVGGHYTWERRRLDITLRPPSGAASQRLIEINAFLDDGFVSRLDLEGAARRGATLVIAPLKPDVREMASDRKELAEIVVPAGETRAQTADSAFQVWTAAVAALRRGSSSAAPISYNFARDFPLRDYTRVRGTVLHVARTSVRDQLRTFEQQPGVRLWCSVRRSGKTMACLDMDSTREGSTVVSQTCSVDESDDSKFFSLVGAAVDEGRRVSGRFVKEAVAQCAPSTEDDQRLVLVIDEYESFFGLLDSAVEGDPGKRYTVVQPILDQLTAFSRDSLLVFLGQRPDAHFILMDQNSLAPYVKQEPFPLFEHAPGTTTGEFSELVHKILGDRVECTATFLDALFGETAGHPFLTANVLGEFVEWLIEERRPLLGLVVKDDDFAKFADHKLNAARILLSPDYDFFRGTAARAMSAGGYRKNPWLFVAYWILRALSDDAARGFRVGRASFPDLMHRIPVPQGEPAPDCHEVLRTASQANFLAYDDDWVRVKIPTLGRIAAAVRPAVM